MSDNKVVAGLKNVDQIVTLIANNPEMAKQYAANYGLTGANIDWLVANEDKVHGFLTLLAMAEDDLVIDSGEAKALVNYLKDNFNKSLVAADIWKFGKELRTGQVDLATLVKYLD